MVGLETVLVKLGSTVARPVFARYLADRRRHEDRTLPLTELITRRTSDTLLARRTHREIESVADAVAGHLTPLCRRELPDLPDNEREAAVAAALATFEAADLSDRAVYAADADAGKLAAYVRTAAPDAAVTAGLSEPATRLYQAVVDETCVCLAQLITQLSSFQARGTAELLSRLTGLAETLHAVYTRLPARTLDAPAGTDLDEQFRHRYLDHISRTLDTIELFGIDVRQYRPRTTLSVAYISLSVRGGSAARRRDRRRGWEPGLLHVDRRTRHLGPEEASLRVESALSGTPRMLIRGEAGSGKSTLLRWLAITAARGHFTTELAAWNGRIPFLVKLRSYAGRKPPRPAEFLDGVAEPLADLMPAGWVHRVLASGRALLMVDGVDELPANQRRPVREWLAGLLAEYPDIRVVVTSRPAAATTRWLVDEGFDSALLDRMSPDDVRALIAHWHDAIRDAGGLPCDEDDLPRYESALLARLDSADALQSLATNPLLCAMLCALNLDRNTQLPDDRIGIYRAAIDLLLERRDAERQISADDVALSTVDKLELLQDLAWWLSVNSRTEMPRDHAEVCVVRKMAGMPRVTATPAAVLDHLLTRSGVLIEPVAGRVEFAHRTFQEYLTAREVADHDHVGWLIEHAHLDTWHDTVILVAGHANALTRTALIEQLLARSAGVSRTARSVRLVAASCLETLPSLDPPSLLARLESTMASLIPPRRRTEARSLAKVGNPVLRKLPRELTGLSEAQAAACVRVASLVNGPEALRILAGYATDPRRKVQEELAECWEYFEPFAYASEVLAEAPLCDGHIIVKRASLLRAASRIRNIRHLFVELSGATAGDLQALRMAPNLGTVLWSGDGSRETLTALLDHVLAQPTIRYLRLSASTPGKLPHKPFLQRRSGLNVLTITNLWTHNLDFLVGAPRLRHLSVGDSSKLSDVGGLASTQELEVFELANAQACDIGRFGREMTALPCLAALLVHGSSWLIDLRQLDVMRALRVLWLMNCPIVDLAPLRSWSQLEELLLAACPDVLELHDLAELDRLKILYLSGLPRLDLSPLARNSVRVFLDRDQKVSGKENLGSQARVRRADVWYIHGSWGRAWD